MPPTYQSRGCSLGCLTVAWTAAGMCWVSLAEDDATGLASLHHGYPSAVGDGDKNAHHYLAIIAEMIESPRCGQDHPSIPLDARGTEFQQEVWRAISHVPLGQTRTYSQVAAAIGHPRAVRAVASACGANPVAILVPCHRIVRGDGGLGGYRWGLERKQRLLEREQLRSSAAKPEKPDLNAQRRES